MQSKRIKVLTLSLLVFAVVLGITGCGKSGTMKANIAPSISITSYEGFDDSALLAPYANTLFLFQQKIYWNATDPDGVIAGFAYRVKDQNGNPIATPGNHYIDLTGDVTPQNVINKYGTGWVMHYLPNASQDLPLDNPQARRTIWTPQKYAVINFPASDANGNPLTMLSTFEVIAVDNRGEITQAAAWRSFNATSARPRCFISTTKGNPNGGEVGSGIRLSFSMKDFDPFIPEVPYKYEFKMMKVHPTTGAVIAGSESEWINSSKPSDPDIGHFLLTRYTQPALTYDVENNVVNSKTKVVARVYDMAGVVSTVSDSTAITFAVKAGFRPKTLIYPQKAYALGDNHFIDYTDESTPEILPFTIIGGAQRFATPFFRNFQNDRVAINSTNMKVWIRWGWRGEYGQVPATGPIIYTDIPYDKKVDAVLDRTTDLNYFSEITHFDLRYDGAEYEYAPYANDPTRHITDGDGKKWLRVPLYSPLGQTVVLTYPRISDGTHTFEVRCVDLQGEVDPVPATFQFTLEAPIPKANRNGILIIDDDSDNASESPEAIVNQKYANMLADYTGPKVFVKRGTETFGDQRMRHLATTELQKYKLVVYHSDRPSESGNLKLENDGLCLYMAKGGNVLVSHAAKLAEVLQAFALGNQKSFLSYFGLPFVSNPASFVSTSFLTRPLFQKAVGQNLGANDVYPDINLQFGTENPSFNNLVNVRHGLSTIAYFGDAIGSTPGNSVTYRLGAKPTTYPNFPPSQADFDFYNNKPVGIRRVNSNNRTWMFGFPLSYMVDADAKAMMNKVLSEI